MLESSKDQDYRSASYYVYWTAAVLLGSVLILISFVVQGGSGYLSRFILALGVSTFAAGILRLLGALLDLQSIKKSLSHHVEIIAERRGDEKREYERENEKAKHRLDILSFSAQSIIAALNTPESNLYKAVFRKGIKLRVLTVDPSCQAAKQRVYDDAGYSDNDDASYPGDKKRVTSAWQKMLASFEELRTTFESVSSSKLPLPGTASVEIRITDESPYLTVYVRDDEAVIFGQYFTPGRGDGNAAMKLSREWNQQVFNQFRDHFMTMWENSLNKQLLLIAPEKSDCCFHDPLFDDIVRKTKSEIMNLQSKVQRQSGQSQKSPSSN